MQFHLFAKDMNIKILKVLCEMKIRAYNIPIYGKTSQLTHHISLLAARRIEKEGGSPCLQSIRALHAMHAAKITGEGEGRGDNFAFATERILFLSNIATGVPFHSENIKKNFNKSQMPITFVENIILISIILLVDMEKKYYLKIDIIYVLTLISKGEQ
ncbi:hypothetical protein ACJX0J_011754, partial [Zea mays]